ncbi:MAG: hypothetical protein AAF483_04680, partial [Planctomycetota bacterium]
FDEGETQATKPSLDDGYGIAKSQTTSILQTCLEEFSGVFILATNRLETIEKAVVSRVLFQLEIGLPDAACREQLWARALGFDGNSEADNTFDIAELAKISEGLSGRDINMAALRASLRCLGRYGPKNFRYEWSEIVAAVEIVLKEKQLLLPANTEVEMKAVELKDLPEAAAANYRALANQENCAS